jgi:nucleoside-diphosphate-sugar epimerase
MENKPLHTLLGSTGVIGTETAKALASYPVRVRLVSRNPVKVNDTDELLKADLMNPAEMSKAVEGSDVVYITIGFPYDAKLWQKVWVPFIQSAIYACANHKAKLVFFDNDYMYAPSAIPFQTEDSPIGPTSKKGIVRAEVLSLLLKAEADQNVNVLVARSADFYGANIALRSVLLELTYENFKKGKAANWLYNADAKHTFSYTKDIGRALAQLGNTPDAFGQTWHVPTTKEALTGREWTALVADAMGVKPYKLQVMPSWLVSLLGLFVPYLKEVKEMRYMYDQDYIFNSDKFEKRFGWGATAPKVALAETIKQNLLG